MSETKQLWILTGGNGSAKSTFYRLFLEPKGMKFVNADLIAEALDQKNPESLSYRASYLAERLRRQLLEQGVSFCFETVFSHVSKVDFVAEARALGYQIVLVYIHLGSPELNEARVSQRVTEGGHSVPKEKIWGRIPRTMQNIPKACPLVDRAIFLDNSSRDEPFRLVAEIRLGRKGFLCDPPPDWARELLREIP